MPGVVVIMENGTRNTLPTNHDRDDGQLLNGTPGFPSKVSPARHNGAGGGPMDGVSGTNAVANGSMEAEEQLPPAPGPSRMNDLPDEIQHITQGYVPLGVLLSRLAQKTHNLLSDEIMTLARMPPLAPAVNGNSAHADSTSDDTSPDNLNKKARLLNFVQERHAEWVKALVITRWSRNAEPVSKLIDLMYYLNTQRKIYDDSLDYLINIKRDLTFARLPDPDLQTALHLLARGQAPWMPDLNYIKPPPISPKEQLEWIEELNTLLSIRLNLEDHDNIPRQFQDYSIESGRVTFKVADEFEVDLTIADEDFEKQFWFIDFRFAFSPAPAELSESLRIHLEHKVNEILEKDGLRGCYKFLHEFILTHKITEYVKQALELSRGGRWVDMLKVERLHRAMAIQYWANRFPPEGPKSWILLGVHSGQKPNAPTDPNSSSYLTLRWFRDNREVKDVVIQLDNGDISTEKLLNRVIQKHIEHCLTTLYNKLRPNERYSKRETGLALRICEDDAAQSTLEMQIGHGTTVTVQMVPTTGFLSMKPQTAMVCRGEGKLNWQSKDPIQDAAGCLESFRWQYMHEELKRRGSSMSWSISKSPVSLDMIKSVLKIREHSQYLWLRRVGWEDNWFILVTMSMSGDRWWLIETSTRPGERISTYTRLPLTSENPDFSDDKFFSNLTIFSAGMISRIVDLRTLHKRHINYRLQPGRNDSLPPNVELPEVSMRLVDVLAQSRPEDSKKDVAYSKKVKEVTSWAHDFVQIRFKGIRHPTSRKSRKTHPVGAQAVADKRLLRVMVDARLKVSDPTRFDLLKGNVQQDVAYNDKRGVFALNLETEVGSTILDTLVRRVQSIDLLANCVRAIRTSDRDVQCEDITLNKLVISYSSQKRVTDSEAPKQSIRRWKAVITLGKDGIELELEKDNPQCRVLDLFRNLINSDLGFMKVPGYLSVTLPVLQALESLEDAWESFATNDRGQVEVMPAQLDHFHVHYVLPGPTKTSPRRLRVKIRLQTRKDKGLFWYVTRQELGVSEPLDDEFKKALDKVWNAPDKVWTFLNDGAAAEPDNRVGMLLKAVDDAVRPLAMQSPSVSRTKAPPVSKSQPGKARPQQAQHTGPVVVLDD
ncbi:mediator complex subunit MED14-domain-containing protein [Xylariomycetidae sp. FL2044]|nr:mediator complex subunit MED14-domain-containing protein [Xylariomycetidae sp. FL2044]